jgi:hypothetical protein
VKRRAFAVALALFAAWPLVQRGLVARHDADPWKLFGWAMYAAPTFPIDVQVMEARGEMAVPLDAAALAPLEEELARFRARRRAFGRLASSESLARHALATHPQLDGVVVVVRTRALARDSARVLLRRDKRVYRRPR